MNTIVGNRFKMILLAAGILCLSVLVACNTDLPHTASDVEDTVEIRKELPGQPENSNKTLDNSNRPFNNSSPGITEDQGEEENAPERLTKGAALSRRLVEEGSTNILLVGEDQLSSLYDTICILSVSSLEKTVKIIMIPRDAYIEYEDSVLAVLDRENKRHIAGVYKINYAHHIGTMLKYQGKYDSSSMSFPTQVLEEKLGIRIHDYAKIDLNGLMSMVDLFGGVEIQVPYDMHYEDPGQELSIHISKGRQHMDGAMAEGFIRFRQGYTEDGRKIEVGDVGRKKNQIAFLQAFIKQHGTLGNINKIPVVLGSLNKNVRHSIGLGDVLSTYMGLARNVITDKYEIQSENLDDTQKRIDGSAYIILE